MSYDEKFEQKSLPDSLVQYPSGGGGKEINNADNVYILLESDFDMETRFGSQAFLICWHIRHRPLYRVLLRNLLKLSVIGCLKR